MERLPKEILEHRIGDYPINPLILGRWSPRAMTGESLEEREFMPLFEAARWAPSAYNNQPWRFLYAKRETPEWDLFFNLLIDFNKSWCKNASLLGLILARTTFEKTGKPSITHAFDTGAAWENLFLEGTTRGLVVHGMQGFDYEKAKRSLNVPEDFAVLAMFAVGKRALKETLPQDLQEKEVPSSRKKLSEIVFKGTFPK